MSLTREQKILIAAGLLVAVLYIGAVANGRGSGEGSVGEGGAGAPVGGLVGVLAGWIGGASDADRAELSADCLDDTNALAVNGSCTLRVAPSERNLRVVRLRTDRPVTVTARLPRSDRAGTADVAAGDETSVAVDGRGDEIRIDCPGTDPCVVTVLNGG
jgi:hypothetical protein